MNFVCDAGPVIALSKVDHLNLLQDLASNVWIPETVYHELLAKPGPDTDRILAAARSFLKVAPPCLENSAEVVDTARDLDPGECEALFLAASFEFPPTVLMDDAAGRRIAKKLAIPVLGFTGLLLLAKRQHLISEVVPLLKQARRMGYWLSDELITTASRLAGK